MILLLLSILVYLILAPSNVIESVNFSISIWKDNLFPTLFPFFIISDLLINYGFVEIASKLFTPLMKFFKIKKECACIFVLSLFSS